MTVRVARAGQRPVRAPACAGVALGVGQVLPVRPSSSSVIPTLVSATLPLLVATNLYVTTWPTLDTRVGDGRLGQGDAGGRRTACAVTSARSGWPVRRAWHRDRRLVRRRLRCSSPGSGSASIVGGRRSGLRRSAAGRRASATRWPMAKGWSSVLPWLEWCRSGSRRGVAAALLRGVGVGRRGRLRVGQQRSADQSDDQRSRRQARQRAGRDGADMDGSWRVTTATRRPRSPDRTRRARYQRFTASS